MKLGSTTGALAVALLAAVLGGCNGGFSQTEATDRCTVERQARNVCVTDAVYDQCVSCFEQCGDSCKAASTCPATYACP